MIKTIVNHRQLGSPVTLAPGDQFRLYVQGELVHSVDISSFQMISHWAYTTLNGHNAYWIGTSTLVDDLQADGFVIVP